jgi:hypothetical protein
MAPTRTSKFFALSTEGAAECRRECKPSSSAWAVLIALCQHADYKTAHWTGRLDFLAEAAGVSRWTTSRQVKWLDANNLIAVERPFGHGDHYAPASIYVCCYADLCQRRPAAGEVQSATHQRRPGAGEVQSATHQPLGEVQSATHQQGFLPVTTNNQLVQLVGCSDDSSSAGEPALPASPDNNKNQFSIDAERFGRKALAKALAKAEAGTGPPVRDEKLYWQGAARRYVPGMRKSPKGTSKRPEQSGTAQNRKLRLARAEHMSAEVVTSTHPQQVRRSSTSSGQSGNPIWQETSTTESRQKVTCVPALRIR